MQTATATVAAATVAAATAMAVATAAAETTATTEALAAATVTSNSSHRPTKMLRPDRSLQAVVATDSDEALTPWTTAADAISPRPTRADNSRTFPLADSLTRFASLRAYSDNDGWTFPRMKTDNVQMSYIIGITSNY